MAFSAGVVPKGMVPGFIVARCHDRSPNEKVQPRQGPGYVNTAVLLGS